MNLRALLLLFLLPIALAAQQPLNPIHDQNPNRVFVDASAPIAAPETGYLNLGGTSSDGHSLQVNSRYLVLDGKPWLPVMGEFHFSRYPAAEWEDEILKMKAAGVNIISTYVFWIHQEEVQGQFDWQGQRDLRHFIQLCSKHRMYVWLRIGPWAHGEVRNGGFPDWIASLPNLRTNDPTYIHYVELFFNQIGRQVRGLMFRDGGPILGVQLENEYGLHGPGRGAEHILKLKQLAIAAGIDAPLYSVTAWPSLDFPPREVIPVSGGYPDGFWYGSQTELPPSITYLFNFNRELGDMGATVPSEDPTGKVDLKHDPYFAAEEGGGMESAYHRRPVLDADDIAALALTGIGSGINLYGYYMFHGGANPTGSSVPLQESTATGYPNDLPEISYDFNAPLGEFGQQRDSYRKTRMLHLFLNSFGSQLATMPAFAPAQRTRDAANTAIPRVAVRTDGRAGFVFVNNYVRQLAMPIHRGFQVRVKLPQGQLTLPSHPVDIPSGAYFAWPFELPLGHIMLHYSTAQLLTQLKTPSGKLVVFFAIPGIAPEFSFAKDSLRDIKASSALITNNDGATLINGMKSGLNSTISLTDALGVKTTILLLSYDEAENLSVISAPDGDHLLLSASAAFLDGNTLHLESPSAVQQCETLPGLSIPGAVSASESFWTRFTFTQPEKHPALTIKQIRQAAPREAMTMGPYIDWRKTTVPVVPPDAAFDTGSQWEIQWNNPDLSGLSDVLLQVDYAGDIARLSSSTGILDDNFFNSLPWQIGLRRFGSAASASLILKILPMPKLSPIYLPKAARHLIGESDASPQLNSVHIIPVYEFTATVQR